jgi:hypothetical protein
MAEFGMEVKYMARSQTWTRNISKKIKHIATPDKRGIVNNEPLEQIKRRAEEVGLILHGKQQGKKKSEKR